MPFIVIIEIISNLIRPGTLAVRLTANIIAGHLLEYTLEYHTRHLSSITIGEMMNSVLNSFHYADMTGDMAFLSSEILSFILCTSAKSVQNTLLFKEPHKKKLRGDRSGERAGQEI
jgi:F0F1-type ATP synthase membrane subunit a